MEVSLPRSKKPDRKWKSPLSRRIVGEMDTRPAPFKLK